MQRNFFERQKPQVHRGGTESGPKPGDFPVGSLESRAAARARLEGGQQPKIRVTLIAVGKPLQLVNSICERSFWPNGTLFECVCLDGTKPTEAQQEQLEKLISKIPIDGKKYTFAEKGVGLMTCQKQVVLESPEIVIS